MKNLLVLFLRVFAQEITDENHEAEEEVHYQRPHCAETPSFPGSTETTCTTVIETDSECYTTCGSSTVTSKCERVIEMFPFPMFLGETKWVHEGECKQEVETREIEISGIGLTAENMSDCEAKAKEVSVSIKEEFSQSCNTCTNVGWGLTKFL